jgi:hypothetical protein
MTLTWIQTVVTQIIVLGNMPCDILLLTCVNGRP